MNSITRTALAAMLLLSSSAFAVTAGAEAPKAAPSDTPEARPAPRASRDENRTERRMRRLDLPAREMVSVTFLGVDTAPVTRTLIEQLNLPDKAGLVVHRVVPDSPAAGVLKQHDILLKLDDQILIDRHQLSVLIRNRSEGDEITLSYVRGGKIASARVKLVKREVPKMADVLRFEDRLHPGAIPPGPGNVSRAEAERMLSLLKRDHPGAQIRMRLDRDKGRGVRGMSVDTGNSNLVFSDELGSLELTEIRGKKSVVAKDAQGKQVFSGDVTTPEARAAMPAELRERLEKLESMQDVTFRTDEDFEGVETRVAPAAEQPAS